MISVGGMERECKQNQKGVGYGGTVLAPEGVVDVSVRAAEGVGTAQWGGRVVSLD